MGDLTRRDAVKLAGLSLPLAVATSALGQLPNNGKFLVLSCDGGGIRGLLSAKIIERLQREIPFLDRVDLFAGTSTGGIIALGLADKVEPAALVDLYRNRGPQIFNKSEPKPPTAGRLLNWVSSVRDRTEQFLHNLQFNPQDLIHPKYPNEGLSAVLTEIFGGRTLNDLKSGKFAMVTTLRLSTDQGSWAPLVLHNVGRQESSSNTRVQDGPTRSTKLVDAALSTSAAPLYFPPHECPGFGYCVDGGLFANCPANLALGLALRNNPAIFDNIRILSIGTGAQTNGIDIRNAPPFDKPSDYGALAWLDPISRGRDEGGHQKLTPAFPLISALFDASSASHNYVCMQSLQDRYRRVQVNLTRPISLDDTDRDSMAVLEQAANSIPDQEWKSIKDWLKAQLV